MKVSDLTGAMLDYWVARAEGYRFWQETRGSREPITACIVQRPGARDPWLRTQNWQAAKERFSEVHSFAGLQPGFFGEGVPKFSTDWAQGGPIIDLAVIDIDQNRARAPHVKCRAVMDGLRVQGMSTRIDAYGPTALVAAMRARVISKYGEEVPDDPQKGAAP